MPTRQITRLALMVCFVGYHFLRALVAPAVAHDFYDPWCCNDKDCRPVPMGNVAWSPQGWQVPSLETTVPFSDPRIRHNPPDVPGFSICEYPKGNLRCLYVPEPQG